MSLQLRSCVVRPKEGNDHNRTEGEGYSRSARHFYLGKTAGTSQYNDLVGCSKEGRGPPGVGRSRIRCRGALQNRNVDAVSFDWLDRPQLMLPSRGTRGRLRGATWLNYDSNFYSSHRAGSYSSAKVVAPLLVEQFSPRSVIDIGCGVGTWLRAFIELGITDVHGIDGEYVRSEDLEIPPSTFAAHDLCEAFHLARSYDVALCLEVAEHLPDGSPLVESLTRIADIVVFSAAIPFQGGTGHVNCQWQSFWVERFSQFDFEVFDLVRPVIWKDDTVDFWYRQNLLVFINAKRPDLIEPLSALRDPPYIDLVHPEQLIGEATGPKGLWQMFGKLGTSVVRTISSTKLFFASWTMRGPTATRREMAERTRESAADENA